MANPESSRAKFPPPKNHESRSSLKQKTTDLNLESTLSLCTPDKFYIPEIIIWKR